MMGYIELIPSSININIMMIIACWSLLIPFAFPVIPDYELGHICNLPDGSIWPFNRNFNTSLALLVNDLNNGTSVNNGYLYLTRSGPDTNHTAHGRALCRGDVSPGDCEACVKNATSTLINTHCPQNRSAIIWRNNCFFKYSDVDFYGKFNTGYSKFSMNDTNWPQFHNASIAAVRMLMTRLIRNASATQNTPMFYVSVNATLQTDGAGTVYEMAQCARDLTPQGCDDCLNSAVRKLFDLTSRPYKGGYVVYDSCVLRYEKYPFFYY